MNGHEFAKRSLEKRLETLFAGFNKDPKWRKKLGLAEGEQVTPPDLEDREALLFFALECLIVLQSVGTEIWSLYAEQCRRWSEHVAKHEADGDDWKKGGDEP